MKVFIGFLCLLAVAGAESDCENLKKTYEKEVCKPERQLSSVGRVACADLCNGNAISFANCTDAPHCCPTSDHKCVLKPLTSASTSNKKSEAADKFKAAFKKDVKKEKGSEQRLFNLNGPPQFPPQFPPQLGNNQNPYYPQPQPCLKFPRNCPESYGPIVPPVDIPYCQRIACSPSGSQYETNEIKCLSQPGCYFDQTLYTYRGLLQQAVLPGVPVCHLAIRNRIFHRRAAEVKRELGSWNPYVTQCLIKEYKEEIFGESVGCKMIDLFEYFGNHPKRAGWPNIDANSCYLIDGCWRRKNGGYCVYPLRVDQTTVRSGNDQSSKRSNTRDLYGAPSCMAFSPVWTGEKFLSSYHQCLARGCAINIDRNRYWSQLYQAGQGKVPQRFLLQYLNMIYNGGCRADNYKSIIEQLSKRRPLPYYTPPFSQPRPTPYRNIPPGLLAYSLNINKNNQNNTKRSFQFPSGGSSNYNPPPGYNPYGSPSGGKPYGSPPSGNPYRPPTTNSFPNLQSLSSLFPVSNPYPFPQPCPYRLQRYHGLPALTGSVAGCCDKPLCYIPRRQIYAQYSGVSSYMSFWSQWDACSAQCGGGRKKRTRQCIGKECSKTSLKVQQRSCNDHKCPRYGGWSAWSACSATCGGGRKSRNRVCTGKGKCVGVGVEYLNCKTGKCPTYGPTVWGDCNKRCGRGYKTGIRKCINGGGYGCPEDETDQKPCEGFCGEYKRVCDKSTCQLKMDCVYPPKQNEAYCEGNPPAIPYYQQRYCCVRSYNLQG